MTQPDEPIVHAAQVHFELADGRTYSLSAALVNLGSAQLLRSSLADVQSGRCATHVIGDKSVPAALRERLERKPGSRHPLVRRALDEVLATGTLPYPDAIAESSEIASRMVARAGRVELRLAFPESSITCELSLVPRRAPIGSWVPRCNVEGTIAVGGVSHAVANGIATTLQGSLGDDRVVVHLDDATLHVWRDGARTRAIIVRSDGDPEETDDVTLTPTSTWTSLYTFHDFAEAWHLQIPGAQIELDLRATFADQELVTVTATEPLWQGSCEVSGTMAGRRVRGVAYVTQSAVDATETMPQFFAAIPRETARALHQELPLPTTFENMLALAGGGFERYVRDVSVEEFERILIQPIREILDRKGKAWRSYAAVMCFYALGGDRRRRDVVQLLLALAETIHVGSLIIDDVEDSSPTRRGGPACHVAHGVPLAINAGSFCYFVWQAWLTRLDLPSAAKLQIYELYFEFMRVGHLGQALDLQGITSAMTDEIVTTGDVALLAKQLKNVYVLKTGAPASVFARFGAIVAGGNDVQLRAIADLFEALGIAFQIMDDVQNLKGFVGDPKHCEDLIGGKLTMPVLEAMRVLDLPARRDLWNRIRRCAQEPALVPSIVDTIDRCGAFTACRREAQVILDAAWRASAPLLDDSVAKIMLRSFCFYVVESLGS